MPRWPVLACLALPLGGCAPWTAALPQDARLQNSVRGAQLATPGEKAENETAEAAAATAQSPPVPSVNLPSASGPEDPGARIVQADTAPGDPMVRRASLSDASDAEMALLLADGGSPATEIAAQVGDTFISTREVKRALAERVRGNEAWNKMAPEQKKLVVRDILQYMIDRAIVVQAARRELNKPKQWDSLKDHIEKMWQDAELPTYLKRYNVQNEVELDHKLAQVGDSLEDVKQSYQQDQISRMFAFEKIRSKLNNPGFQEIYPYYRRNIAKYQRPAELEFREVFLPIDAEHTAAQARAEADAAWERIRQGEPFEQVARTASRGSTAAQGGLWKLAPNSYGAPAVNSALERMNLGECSGVLQDARGCYIVRLESRRPAGPIPFEEIQSTIVAEMQQLEYDKAYAGFVAEIRKRAVVRSPLLDGLAGG